ncbi:hypothetical protein [Haliscomenobacter sp.]|uniref:hypothetical protein n=1 Tax=Haliscomenobacter sp. TaxID=2717303 RepID=UPI003593A4CE
MKILFALFLCIDVIILLILGYEAFMVSSNKKHIYRRRFTGLLGLMAAALVLSFYRFNLALWLVGVPAVGVLLFTSILLISMLTHKGPWH